MPDLDLGAIVTEHLGVSGAAFEPRDYAWCDACGADFPCETYRLAVHAQQQAERIECARAACVSLGHLAQGVLSALDGDPAQQGAES